MYENRNYVIFSIEELNKINFNDVLETSAETVRKSVDGTKTFVKWDRTQPSCIELLTTKSNLLTHDELLSILQTEEWSASPNLG